MSSRLIIIDGDMIAYRNAAAIETPAHDWGDGITTPASGNVKQAKDRIKRQIDELMTTLNGDAYFVALSCLDHECFRRDLLPTYKINRINKVRPSCLTELKVYLAEKHKAVLRPKLEADDIMGIKATEPGLAFDEKVIVSIDKDLRQIPGVYYNPFPHKAEPKEERISKTDGDEAFLTQVLVGDDCDNYKGCPGIGPVKAHKILHDFERRSSVLLQMWEQVVKAYEARGLTEADALIQARVARILRFGEWTPKTGVKLWQKPLPFQQ